MIEREKNYALEGKPAFIKAKMNSLCDAEIIAALYEASAAGVEIDLVVRGICCLKVGIPEISERIHVRSIVGDFLEHSRIYYFHNDGREEIYLGSADWMPRNLDKRVEIIFPVEDNSLKEEVIHMLDVELSDNVKARALTPDGSYVRIKAKPFQKKICAQDTFREEALAVTERRKAAKKTSRRFEPQTNDDLTEDEFDL